MSGPGSDPSTPAGTTGASEITSESDSGCFTEYDDSAFDDGPGLVFGGGYTGPGPAGGGYSGPGGTGGGGGYSPPEGGSDSSGNTSATPSGYSTPDPSTPSPEDVFRDEYNALIDGTQWPITTLDEITTLVGPTMFVMAGDVISTKMSSKYPGCLAQMEMIQEDSWIPNTGWKAISADVLALQSWWPSYQAYATASIGIWRTPNCCTYTDPDQGVVQTYWANLFGHASQPSTPTLRDPAVRDSLYRNSGPSPTEFGSQILPDPLVYHEPEEAALKTKFGFTPLAGGDARAECIYRLDMSLNDILDSLETGFVPRTDVIKIVPRIKVENRSFERITQKENKQDILIGQTVGNPNAIPNVVNVTARRAVSTARAVLVGTMIPGATMAATYLSPSAPVTDTAVTFDPATAGGMGGSGAADAITPSSAGAGPGPSMVMGGMVGGSTFPGPFGGPGGSGGGY